MLEELARQKAGKVVLEVELPEDSLKKRRIGFYERHGFTLTNIHISSRRWEKRHEIPRGSCQHPEPLSEDEFPQSVRTELYEKCLSLCM